MYEQQRSWFPWNIRPLTEEKIREALRRDGRELLRHCVKERKKGRGGTIELFWRRYV